MKALPAVLFFLIACSATGTAINARSDSAAGTVRLTAGNKIGTGICLDTPCSHVLTNYHVTAWLGPHLKAEGVKVATIVAATSAQDAAAEKIEGLGRRYLLQYDPGNDLALLVLERPLSQSFRGLPFAGYEPEVGQKIKTFGYVPRGVPLLPYNKTRLVESTGEVLSVGADVASSVDKRATTVAHSLLLNFPAAGGNSGGPVVDGDGRVVGIVYGAQLVGTPNEYKVGGTMALSLAVVCRFLREKDPGTWAHVFFGRDQISAAEESALIDRLERRPAKIALAAQGSFAGSPLDAEPVIAKGTDNHALVVALQQQARERLAGMTQVFAEQQLEMWGETQPRQSWRHEVAVFGEHQSFRPIKADGTRGKPVAELPFPDQGVRPGGEWYHLLAGVATLDRLLQYKGTTTYSGKRVHVFRYDARVEDKVCNFAERSASLFNSNWVGWVECSGEVITDEQFNPLQIVRELYLPVGRITWFVALKVNYAFIDLQENHKPLLLPQTISMAAQFETGEWHFASANWTNYHRFYTESHILADVQPNGCDGVSRPGARARKKVPKSAGPCTREQ